jgi:hypothetical protein
MNILKHLPANVRSGLRAHIGRAKIFLHSNPPDLTKLDDFTAAVDAVTTSRDFYFNSIDVDVLGDFKEMLLENLRAAASESRHWGWNSLTIEEQQARARADGCLNRVNRLLEGMDGRKATTSNARRKARGRPVGSPTADHDNQLFADYMAARRDTRITKTEFLKERGLPESDLAAIERGRGNARRRQAGRNALDTIGQGQSI